MARTLSTTRHLLVVTLFVCASIASAGDISITTPQANVAVEPGQSVDVPIVFANQGSVASAELNMIMPPPSGDYTFEQLSEPDCGPVVPAPNEAAGWNEFSIAPIAAGASVTCTIRVDRGAAEINNALMIWEVFEVDAGVYFDVGTFVDIGITDDKLTSSVDPDGTVHATFRLHASDTGAVGVDNVLVALQPMCVQTSIVIDMSFPGACQSADAGCPFEGSTPAAQMPPIAAGGTASCLVSFTAPPNANLEVQAYLAGLQDAATGGYIADDNDSNNTVTLNLSPGGIAAPASAPTLSWWSLGALIFALAAIAATRRRARR